jgi:hypothetical protein
MEDGAVKDTHCTTIINHNRVCMRLVLGVRRVDLLMGPVFALGRDSVTPREGMRDPPTLRDVATCQGPAPGP